MMKVSLFLCLLMCVGSTVAQKRPLNIILTNDDGFETPLIQSLFNQLVLAGHTVVMSAPYAQQSGTSATIAFLRPITPTTAASARGTIAAGAPGIGNTTIKPNLFYVNGAVTGAALYGIDVLAPSIFGAGKIDLLISGPNEGQNVGLFSPHSGTVGAVVTTLNRGNVPSIACSADSAEPQPDLVGQLMVKFINGLNRTSTGGLNFGTGIGLNLNFPKMDSNTGVNDYSFYATTTGIATNTVGLRFIAKLSDCPIAVASGVNVPLPGLCLDAPYTASGYPLDSNPLSEGNLIQDGQRSIAVSVIQGTYQADAAVTQTVVNSIPFASINGASSCRSTFNVFDAATNTKVSTLLAGGTILNPPCSMNIEIQNVSCAVVGPMKINTYRDGNIIVGTRTENQAAYYIFGDNGAGDVFGGSLPVPGSYSFDYTFNGVKRGPIAFQLSASFKLYNAISNLAIGTYGNGATIMNPPCGMNFEILTPGSCSTAGVGGPITIRLVKDGAVTLSTRNETKAPYFAFGDNGSGDVLGETLLIPGNYALVYGIAGGKTTTTIPFKLDGICKA